MKDSAYKAIIDDCFIFNDECVHINMLHYNVGVVFLGTRYLDPFEKLHR